jgi:hypothetical protein
MKFLLEGRKEDLLKKYSSEYDLDLLDTVLNDSFIKSTNYKYADWILKNLEFTSTSHALQTIELVKTFDRIGKNLQLKDINQYPDLAELRAVIDNYASKSQEKKVDSEAKRIFEDSRVLIIRPYSHKASCKYGAGTKWCTTQSSPGYYHKYTSTGNALYYVIIKDLDSSNKFYKMALHKTKNNDTWYDSYDIQMPPREVEMIVLGIGKKGFEAIENDFKSTVKTKKNEIIDKLFAQGVVTQEIKNFFDTGKNLVFTLGHPSYIPDMDSGEIKLQVRYDNEIIEQGNIFFKFDSERFEDENIKSMFTDIGFSEDDEFTPKLHNWNTLYKLDFVDLLPIDGENLFNEFYGKMLKSISNKVIQDENFLRFIKGQDKSFWRPARNSYGYTFKENKGLINKLVTYIDSGKRGNALDFLVDSEILTMVNDNGVKKYLNKNGARIQPKGYFSSFFASAILAKIISYERQGRRFILSKGENFDKFKEGKLIPLDK